MSSSEMLRRRQLKDDLESWCRGTIEDKVDRYLEIEHQGIIGGHHFAAASSECIYLYRDGYFIGAVMMSHAINEGIIKFIAERNGTDRQDKNSNTRTIEDLINEFEGESIITSDCAIASKKIWGSYRNDIHHMNPAVAKIPFSKLAEENLKRLSIIEKEIFGHHYKDGAIILHQPKYWDANNDGTVKVWLRLE